MQKYNNKTEYPKKIIFICIFAQKDVLLQAQI